MNNGLSFFIEMRAMMTSTLAQVERAAKHTLTQVEKTTTNTLAQVGKAANHVLAQVSKSATHIVSQVGKAAKQAASAASHAFSQAGRNASHMMSQVGRSARHTASTASHAFSRAGRNASHMMSHVAQSSRHAANQASGAINNTFRNISQQAARLSNVLRKGSSADASSPKKGSDGFLSKVGGNIRDKVIGFAAGLPGKALDKVLEWASEGVNKAKEQKAANEELANIMLRNNTYSEEGFEKTIAGIKDLTKNTAFSVTEMTQLQSELGRSGIKGEDSLKRISKASADLASRFKIDLASAGKMLTGALKNPQELKSLANKLNIAPKELNKVQKTMQNGKKGEAENTLAGMVESKVGGAAQEGFKKDPFARIAKLMDVFLTSVGEAALQILDYVQPIFDFFESLNIGQGLEDGLSVVTELTSGWGAYIDVIKETFLYVWDIIVDIAGNVWHIIGGIIEWIKKSELMQDLFSLLGKLVGTIGDAFKYVWQALAWVWDNILKPILDAIEKAWKWLKGLFGKDGKVEIVARKEDGTTNKLTNQPPPPPVAPATTSDRSKLKLTDLNNSKYKPDGVDSKASTNNSGRSSSPARGMAQGITSGGPRVININGVKFTDKIELHSVNVKEGVNEIQGMLEEMFLRILNSGAVLQ